MVDVLNKLIELLDLDHTGDDLFLGESEDLGFKNVFGGQVLGQALMAACRTVDNRLPHSMHGYFLRAGDPMEKIQYRVERIRDGASFCTRRVMAIQHGREIFTLNASFQSPEEGFSHQFAMPDTTPPEELVSELELRRKFAHLIPEKIRDQSTRDRPIEIRPVKPLNYFKPDKREPYKQNWFRTIAQMSDDQVLHRCLLAYASDFGLLGTSMLPHEVTYYHRGMQVASLDHCLWFHRDFRIDDWLLYDMDSPSASQGRGLNRGNIYNREGVMVASVTQEALIRKRSRSDK